MSGEVTVGDLLEAMRRLGRQVSFYPSLAKLIGVKEAIFLQQLVYWTPKARNERGWIYKSAEDLEDETSLTYREQQRVRATLCNRGLVEERYDRTEHRLYFRVVRDAVQRLAPESDPEHRAPDKLSDAHLTKSQVPPDESSTGTLPFVSSYKEQEKTSENTTLEVAARIDSAKHIEADSKKAVQLKQLLSKAGKAKSSCPGWVRNELEESLYRGIHHRAIENTFVDARFLKPIEQLKDCVRVAVTTVMTSRVATLKHLDGDDIEQRALRELLGGLDTLSHLGDFETRRRQTVQAVTRAVIGQCVRMLGPGEVVVR